MGTELRPSKVIPPWVKRMAHHSDIVKNHKKIISYEDYMW